MKISSGGPAHWVGWLDPKKTYPAGAIGIHNGAVMVSKLDDNSPRSGAWADIGPVGASPTRVVHRWHPQVCMYPVGDSGEMSEPVEVCADCWKDADYKNAFRPERHFYLIRELGAPS